MEFGVLVVLAIAVFVVVLAVKGITLVQQAETMVIERLGQFHRTLEPGINVIWPVIDRPRLIEWKYSEVDAGGEVVVTRRRVTKIDLRETVFDFPRQSVITKDNVVTEINALIYFQVTDPVKAVYEIANLPDAIEKLTQTTLRNIIGEMDLDETLSSRDTINARLKAVLDEATNKWGVKVNRVELQDVNPPEAIRKIVDALAATGSDPAAYLIAARYVEALKEMVSGENNKVVYIPYEATGVLASLGGIKDLLDGHRRASAPERRV